MYIGINRMATKEEVDMYKMKIREEDTAIDYLVDLTALSQTEKDTLCKTFNIKTEKIEGEQTVTLFCNNEV